MKAYLGDPELKKALLAELANHEAADAIQKGLYGEMGLPTAQFKGCAIGCALHSLNVINGKWCPQPREVGDHSRFESQLDIPVELAYHIDTVFENLPDAESRTWPRRVLEAIPVGAHLDTVIPTLLQWMILDPTKGFIALAGSEFHNTYRQFAALVDQDWKLSGSVSSDQWAAIDSALASDEVGVGAWARARVGAGAWARARAGAWARARAGVGAFSYSALSEKTLALIRECK